MKNFDNISKQRLGEIFGGDDSNYGSVFHPRVWWYNLEKAFSHPGKPGRPTICENYTPAYPGKVLPQC